MKLDQNRWDTWLRACTKDPSSPARIAKGALGALTGQDTRAIAAIAACWRLYASSDDDGATGALDAVRALLPAMQPQTRYLARELIAWALDWNDRARLWPKVAEPTTLYRLHIVREENQAEGEDLDEWFPTLEAALAQRTELAGMERENLWEDLDVHEVVIANLTRTQLLLAVLNRRGFVESSREVCPALPKRRKS